jgi:spore photoproduct lyase
VPTTLPERLLDIKTIYHEPGIEQYARAGEVLDRYPAAERIEVPSHQNIPGLYGNAGNVKDWVRVKRDVLVLGAKKSLTARPNERSSDFIAPSTSNGCALACSYCYVPRRKGYANPITVFVNIEKILGYLERHAGRQGVKTVPNQCDPRDWVYELQPGRGARRVAGGVGRAVRPDRRRHQRRRAAPARRRDHLPDPQRGSP